MIASVGPEHECPDCKKRLNAALSITDSTPRLGDVTMCMYCGCIGLYEEGPSGGGSSGGGWTVKKLTDEEVRGLDRMQDWEKDQIFEVRKMVIESIGKAKEAAADTVWN